MHYYIKKFYRLDALSGLLICRIYLLRFLLKHLSDRFVTSINLKLYNMTYKAIKIYAMFFFFILTIPLFTSCEDEDEDLIGNWVELSDFDGMPRGDAAGFAIGTNGYVGTGYDEDGDRLNDFWQYNALKNTWTQKADFPGVGRNGATGFGTDSKGYIGTGYDGKNKLKDFYEYDPTTNTWTQKADFAGSARYGASAMSINNKGYVTCGYNGNNLKDFWQYSPETDAWEQKTSMGGSKRIYATTFVIDGIGYLLTGYDNGYEDDVWAYDPNTDSWTEKRKISDDTDYDFDDEYINIVGSGKVGLAINGKGYLATGGSSTSQDVWEYDPIEDLWTARTEFEGGARGKAVGFVINNVGYVATGGSGSSYYDDIWGFYPQNEFNEDD